MLFLSSISKGVLYIVTLVMLPVLLIAFCVLLAGGKYDALMPIAIMCGVMCYISTKL